MTESIHTKDERMNRIEARSRFNYLQGQKYAAGESLRLPKYVIDERTRFKITNFMRTCSEAIDKLLEETGGVI